ncbi:hypothetical protein GCM10009682_61240 [Luedemannella flava]|uniref:Uncharacterized protein n=1 Tax=Luedemannella flava TaxID=349316 RepID=A0ABP4Z5D6_9ACTN
MDLEDALARVRDLRARELPGAGTARSAYAGPGYLVVSLSASEGFWSHKSLAEAVWDRFEQDCRDLAAALRDEWGRLNWSIFVR